MHAIEASIEEDINDNELEDDQALVNPCFYFLCRKDPAFQSVKQMVQNFWQAMQTHHVKPGDLLVFSHSARPEEDAYFLGVLLKRPLLHTMVQAVVNDQEAEYKLSEQGLPNIVTSHEYFLHVLRDLQDSGNNDFDSIQLQVEVWRCQAFLEGNCLKANPQTCIATFSMTDQKSAQKAKVKIRSMFKGLSRKKRSAKRKRVNRKVSKKEAAAKAKALAIAGTVLTCDSDSEGVKNSSSSSDSESDSADGDQEKVSENMVPPSDAVSCQEGIVNTVAKEIEESDSLREKTSQAVKPSSFFAKELGLADVGLALSGRSVCLCCKLMIPKSSVRFAWQYSRAKPHGWIHASCLVRQVSSHTASDHERSIQTLLKFQKQYRDACSSSKATPAEAEILGWINKTLEALQKK